MNLYGVQLEAMMVIMAIAALMLDAFKPSSNERFMGCSLAAILIAVFAYSFRIDPVAEPLFGGLIRLDMFALFFKRLFLLSGAFALIMATEFEPIRKAGAAESYALILIAVTGMMLLASATDFILFFVALELVAVTFYVLTSYLRDQDVSLEAGMKYLVMGALAGGFTVYGISYIFGSTGSTKFDVIRAAVMAGEIGVPFQFGMLMILMGVCFKIASVPMHTWAPDVYQGAPAPVTGLLATGSKIAGFAVFLRLFSAGLIPNTPMWQWLLAALASSTMLWGNFGALPQRDIKRVFGYSSIGHAGFILMGFSAGGLYGASAVLFYLVQYLFTVSCAFLVIVATSNATGSSQISSFAGLHRRSPPLALALFLSLVSLAGIPPLSGSFGKIFLFSATLGAAQASSFFYILVAVGALAVVASLYVYFGIIRSVYVDPAANEQPIRISRPLSIALLIAMAGMISLGFFAQPMLDQAILIAQEMGFAQ